MISRFLSIVVALLALASTAHAGDNSCLGKVVVEGRQGKIVAPAIKLDGVPTQPAYVCGTFAVDSAAGRKILKVCPVGSDCSINQDLPPGGDVSKKKSLEIKKPYDIEKMR